MKKKALTCQATVYKNAGWKCIALGNTVCSVCNALTIRMRSPKGREHEVFPCRCSLQFGDFDMRDVESIKDYISYLAS